MHPDVHKIVVREVIQTTSYTYVHAEEEDGVLTWIAVPKMAAEINGTYYYQGGVDMGAFESRELDRTFKSIVFTNGLISKDLVEGGRTSLSMSGQRSEASVIRINEAIEPAEGGVTISELYANKENYANRIVTVRGKVSKYNPKIMGRNWIHIQDSAANQGKMDLTATTMDEAKVWDVITIQGMLILDKDFGAGYFYDIILENSRILETEK